MTHPVRTLLTSLALVAALATTAQAVPAPPFPIRLESGDGAVLLGRMYGDEHRSWIEDPQGFTVAFDAPTRTWRYAQLDAVGRLQPGPHRAGLADARALGLAPHLEPAIQPRRWTSPPAGLGRLAPVPLARAPLQGTVPNLVLLVKFKNHLTTWQPADFDPVFNGPTGSVRHYYDEVSSGRLQLQSFVTDWIELPNDDVYYAYSAANETEGRPEEMVAHAVAVLNQQGFDFTRFDSDHDGVIDAIDVIHSGPGYETTGNPSLIHSHYAPLLPYQHVTTHDGVKIVAYHTEPEFAANGSDITPIGVVTHETGHFFGLPDLYDPNYRSAGLGRWCLMSGGSWAGPQHDGTWPTHMSAWAKAQLGWATVSPVPAEQPVRLAPVETSQQLIRVDQGMPDQQYFLIENRQRTGFDQYLPGNGLLIFHIDEAIPYNTNPSHYKVDLEQADGERQLNRFPWGDGDSGDPFPYGLRAAFSPETTPNSAPYGAEAGRIWISAITREEQDVLFRVEARDPAEIGVACKSGFACASGFCVDGVCCDRACSAGTCEACSAARGAWADGRCTELSVVPCDDNDPCTLDDRCESGACKGGAPMTCEPRDSCHLPGVCVFETGRCTEPRKDDGASCEDGNLCTTEDYCVAGFCQPGPARVCEGRGGECSDQGTCEPSTGLCREGVAPAGTPCSKGSCFGGVCVDETTATDGGTCGCAAGAGSALPLGALVLVAGLRRRRPSQS